MHGLQALSQHSALASFHAGVFEAKHKSMAGDGQKGQLRYRAQMRRAVALSLQQAATAGGVRYTLPGIMTLNSNSMMGPMANRGVGAMLPQLAGASHAAAAGGVNALAAAAAAAARGLASASSLSAAAYPVPTSGLVLPGVHSLGPHAAGMSAAASPASAAAQFGQNFMPGGFWVSHCQH
jgi:hypothetical protein